MPNKVLTVANLSFVTTITSGFTIRSMTMDVDNISMSVTLGEPVVIFMPVMEVDNLSFVVTLSEPVVIHTPFMVVDNISHQITLDEPVVIFTPQMVVDNLACEVTISGWTPMIFDLEVDSITLQVTEDEPYTNIKYLAIDNISSTVTVDGDLVWGVTIWYEDDEVAVDTTHGKRPRGQQHRFSKGEKGRYWICPHCGFIVDSNKVPLLDSNKIGYSKINTTLTTPIVLGGCPLCGKGRYR